MAGDCRRVMEACGRRAVGLNERLRFYRYGPGQRVAPQADLALVFAHYLLHEGVVVSAGQKYVLRSDVMYGPAQAGRT
jgi:hypothetical protein